MLITCLDCGKAISDQAVACPNCGRPVPKVGQPPKPSSVRSPERTKKSLGYRATIGCLSVCLLLVVILIVSTIRSGGPNVGTSPTYQGEQTGSKAPASTIDYKTAAQWSIPNGGYGRVIVIARQNLNDPEMRQLGEQLRYETRSQRNAFVFIYDDARAASLRQAALDESLSKADLSFHDQHLVGAYIRNTNTGFHQLAFGLQGINGPQGTVNY